MFGLAVVLLCSPLARAGSVQLEFNQVDPWKITTVHFSPATGASGDTVFIGRYNSRLSNPLGSDAEDLYVALGGDLADTSVPVDLEAWCIDVYQRESTAPRIYDLDAPQNAPLVGSAGHPMGSDKAADLNRLFVNVFASEVLSDPTNRVVAAAFQAAIWEIVNESEQNAYDVDTGAHRLTGSYSYAWRNKANLWLGELGDDDVDGGLHVLTNQSHQDFAFYVPPSQVPPQAVPEPVTMLAAGSALIGLGGYIRRRRRA
jgi:hypothetical protein